jgi:excisionase family DNA binding protein
MSLQDIAAECGVPIGSVYRWVRSGSGPRRIAIGKHRRVRRADFTAWLDSRVIEPGHA